jgi:tetratricopeptide (TPR) repeat protein
LIRDAAYDALPKSTRVELHELFAVWIDEHGADLVELDEIVGHHLERAYRYRIELAPADGAAAALAERAAARLGAAGTKAIARADVRAATNLLGRAVELFPPGDARRLGLLPWLGRALHETGEWDLAERFLREAIDTGKAAGERRTAADASVALTHLRAFTGSYAAHAVIRRELDAAAAVFEELGDEAGLARALGIAGQLRFWAGQSTAAIEELERSARHARNAGDRLQEHQSVHYMLLALMIGPTPAGEALDRIEQIQSRSLGDRRLDVSTLRCQALLQALSGEMETARALCASAMAITEELGLQLAAAGVSLELGRIELLGGRPDAAERAVRRGVETLDSIGDRGHIVTLAPVLAEALVLLGRTEEAASYLELTERWAMEDDIDPQIARRRVQAKIEVQRGELASAESLAREAVRIARGTDWSNDIALAVEELADVLRLAGRGTESSALLNDALRLYEQKENVVSAARIRVLLHA